MLRRISSSSIVISIVLLALASVTVLGQTTAPVQTFNIATPQDGVLKGILFTQGGEASATSTNPGSTVWSAPGSTVWSGSEGEAATDASQAVITFTGSDGTTLQGIVIGSAPGSTVWSAPGSTVWSGSQLSSLDETGDTPKTIIITGVNGSFRGVVQVGAGAPTLKGLIYADK